LTGSRTLRMFTAQSKTRGDLPRIAATLNKC